MNGPAHVETSASPDLYPFLEGESARVEAALASVSQGVLAGIAEPLAAPTAYALATRGKRVRPMLCAAAYRAIRGTAAPEGVYRLACAVEVLHTYSLVHDDLPCMDDDDLRRGRPTVHRVHGVGASLLAGAGLVVAAVEVLLLEGPALGLSPEQVARLVSELCIAAGAGGMAGGQMLDLEAEDSTVSAEALERIHRAKTGALLSAALRIGGIAAGADEEQLLGLTVYGEELGLAFQIVDDVLDEVGDAAELGKTVGRDSSLRKATYPLLYGIDGALSLARERSILAVAALVDSGIRSTELEGIARYVVERRG